MSLRRRLLLTLAPLFIAGLVAVDIATYVSLQSFLVSRVDDQLRTIHVAVEQYVTNSGGGGGGIFGGPPGGSDDTVAPGTFPQGTFGEIVTPGGALVAGQAKDIPGPNGEQATSSLELPSSLTPQTYLTVTGSSGDKFRAYVDEARFGNGNGNGDLLVVALPLRDASSTLSQLLILELIAGLGITIVILVATWLIVRRGLRPLERMGATARVAATDLSMRVEPAADSSEVGRLGLAINAMLSQLESAFAERAANEKRLRHFISDASHELRTPLTSMRGYAELLRRTPVMTEEDVQLATRRIEDETRRMGVLVDDLLLLARLDQGRPLERAPVDLEALVNDACADARATDPTRAITSRVDAPVQVIGDDMRLRQVLGNVVRNALVHTPPGTPVEVSLSVEGSRAVIAVVDHGHGVQGDRRRVFERFHRSDPERSADQGGSGLGLSITAAVLAAHGGRIEVRDTPGGGATFRIELPGAEVTAVSQTGGRAL
jgi:two-component system OmpR family sensor kinase